MARIALGIEYDGSGFHGWQSQQPGVETVQQRVETALARVADHPVSAICAGRTDAGVHAVEQVVHFDSSAERSLRAWVLGPNTHLPATISLRWAREVDESFHARYSALARRYRYVILNRAVRSALHYGRATWHHYPLDAGRMHTAGQALLGEHDFSAFRARECQSRSPWRELRELTVRREGDRVILEIEANAFLHHMVRNIVGTLLVIGRGERPLEWAGEVLAARDRTWAGITAPAAGLYLHAVRYPAEFGLPPGPESPGFGI